MLDFAVDNMEIGMKHIDEHPTQDGHVIHTFFDDTVKALILSKNLSRSGHHINDFLRQVEHEMEVFGNDLHLHGTENDNILADYLTVALKEVNIARYLEELYHTNKAAPANDGKTEHTNPTTLKETHAKKNSNQKA